MVNRNVSILITAVTMSQVIATTGFSRESYDQNVILVTIDGVRKEEVFQGSDPNLDPGHAHQILFPRLYSFLGKTAFFIGDSQLNSTMTVSNFRYLSLPGYQSIFAGFPQFCWSNTCGRISSETFTENILKTFHLNKHQVATIASWTTISNAVESSSGLTFVNTGISPLDDGFPDPMRDQINQSQVTHLPPWKDARYDEFTFAHAFRYLKVHRPRLLYISLNDSDEWAHKENYSKYIETLVTYDQWISSIIDELQTMGDYGRNTTLIVTTDHGRGTGKKWSEHNILNSSSKNVWLYAYNSHFKSNPSVIAGQYSHSDLRPTIETLFGVPIKQCFFCGKPIEAIIKQVH